MKSFLPPNCVKHFFVSAIRVSQFLNEETPSPTLDGKTDIHSRVASINNSKEL